MDRCFPVCLFVIINFTCIFAQSKEHYNICANEKFDQVCQQLDRSGLFSCDKIKNNVECILDVNNKFASFGVITADEAAIAAPILQDNINVIGEIRPADRSANKTDYDIVVIFRTDSSINKPADVKGKKLCHPGFGFLQTTDFMLEEFTDAMITANQINLCSLNEATLIQRKISALATLFGPSCRPGPWVRNEEFDKKLKQRYPSLCSLCPNGSCSWATASTTFPSDPFAASLDCLISGKGEIAITSRHAVDTYLPRISRDNYRYYCRNDGTSVLNQPCEWSRQPWSLLIANKDESEKSQTVLKKYLNDILVAPDRIPFTAQEDAQYIKKIIMENGEKIDGRLNITTYPIGLATYMKAMRSIPSTTAGTSCGMDIRWCTTSRAEQDKCSWFAQAYTNQGIIPVLRCIQADDQLDCLDIIKSNTADILTAPVRYGFIGRRKNLTAVAYPETKSAEKIKTMVVVKNSDSLPDDGSSITTFENMKDKRGCFPEYGGVSWFSWVDIGRQLGVLPIDSCDYGKLASDFLSEACMPGAKDNEHEVTVETDTDRMCQLCRSSSTSKTATNCNADEENEFFNVTGALKCLDEVGDFAVIGLRNEFSLPNIDKYRVLCRNNTLAKMPGLKIDEACSLSTVIDSEILIRRGDPKHDNIRYALEQIEATFARNLNTPFEVFNRFNKTLDLLFMDSTPGLAFEDSNYVYIRNYVELTSHFDNCVASGKSDASSSHLSSSMVVLLFLCSLSFVLVGK